ncbi:MAG: hypothetical protein HeimC2_07940 [Candidatus Heimdallarchaeota archaeon LC_2]|nr:MAG: hypothetical protein HeimC2_07940 [Candidatus Heimdallarchaeota archaeon LC_2]
MENAYTDLEVEAFDRTDMREIVASKVKWLRKDFNLLPIKLERFNLKLAKQLKEEWESENKEFVKNTKGEKPLQRLERWRRMVKAYRSRGLKAVADKWYHKFWKLRSELALVVALYEFSEIEDISKQKSEITKGLISELKPLSLRIKGPRKPTKKKILIRDIKYDIEEAFLEMIQPMEIKTIETRELINKLIAPSKKLKITIKKKRFKDALIAREYLTIITQAVAPRQNATNNTNNDMT